MNPVERQTTVESIDKDGKVEKMQGPFVLVVDPEKNRLGVRDQYGHIFQIPLSDVVDTIRENL